MTQGSFIPGPGDIEVSTNPGPHPVGFVQPDSGTYDNYTQWVYHENDTLTLVEDKGPVVTGIMSLALSPDGHEMEMAAPFKGFLNNAAGEPNVRLGNIIDVSFSLEASGELASPPGFNGQWASDTADTIFGYKLETLVSDISMDGYVNSADSSIMFSNWAETDLLPSSGNLNNDEIVNAVERSVTRLDDVMAELVTFSRALNNSQGSLGQFVNNPDLYQQLNRAATNIEQISRRLRPIVEDARVFTDKIARDPGRLGVKGALDRRRSGIK